jgi:hypothetical protein
LLESSESALFAIYFAEGWARVSHMKTSTKQNKIKANIAEAKAAYEEAIQKGNLGEMQKFSLIIDRLIRQLASL